VMVDVLVDPNAEENFIAALARIAAAEQATRIVAAEQAARFDAAEQATNTSWISYFV
ncbi:hypothetical protein Tco_1177541, partial [Tanacetum coccineum]